VFGAVDGLVTNASLIAGVGGSGVSSHTIVLTGLAGLVAGAFSIGTGEYMSVTNQTSWSTPRSPSNVPCTPNSRPPSRQN